MLSRSFIGVDGSVWQRRSRFLGARLLCACLLLLAAGLFAPESALARYASMVIDAETGKVLHAVNQDTRNYPASLTKIMTLYMAFEALDNGTLKLDQRLKVSRRAAGMPPSKLGLRKGDTIRVRDVILALVTKSANDAAVVMAEALGGKETTFARMMTKRARALGMGRTTFRNASGLPNRGQLSTARDMAKLAQALLRDYPGYYHYFSTKTFNFRGRKHRNHNKLLSSYAGTDGIKTGYIRASGFNLVASVERNDRRIIAVVFGGKTSRSRDRHMKKLLDRGFTKLAELRFAKEPPLPRRKPVWPPPTQEAQQQDVKDAALVPAVGAAEARPIVTAAGALAGAPPKVQGVPQAKPAIAMSRSGEVSSKIPSLRRNASLASARPGKWGVQVGAFKTMAPAHHAAAKAAHSVPELLLSKPIMVTSVEGDYGKLYRARVEGLDETSAREACRQLSSLSVNCVVVPPSNG